jgi:hypothetical protein
LGEAEQARRNAERNGCSPLEERTDSHARNGSRFTRGVHSWSEIGHASSRPRWEDVNISASFCSGRSLKAGTTLAQSRAESGCVYQHCRVGRGIRSCRSTRAPRAAAARGARTWGSGRNESLWQLLVTTCDASWFRRLILSDYSFVPSLGGFHGSTFCGSSSRGGSRHVRRLLRNAGRQWCVVGVRGLPDAQRSRDGLLPPAINSPVSDNGR